MMVPALAMTAAQVPPPVLTTRASERQLQAWLPGDVRCTGEAVAPVALRRPYLAYGYFGAEQPTSVTYRFRIDASGRPLSIARAGEGYTPFIEDIGPSLAASRFPAGAERRECAVTYTARRTGYAETPLPDLVSYTLNPAQGQLPHEAWAAIYPAAASCAADPHPEPLVQVYPAFDDLPGTPGVRDWTMLGYDLDAKGAPVRVAVLTGTGNRALDAAAARALARSRYTRGPRNGCRYPYWKAAATVAPPPAPELASFRRDGATCPASVMWTVKPPLVYPEPYRKRAIEGWAVIGFDLAPWGEPGSVKVLASEPSDDFGQAAAQLIRGARTATSPSGYSGCVERVRFAMARPGQAATAVAGGLSVPPID